jgi:thymidylate synthase (FAD)
MKIITEPSVHLLGLTQFFPHPDYIVPDHDNEQEQLIATAGKVCYDSFGPDGRSVDQHITGLVSSKHFSVVEHVNVSIFIAGISRGLSHEFVRHRHFSYSQRSTRYTAEEDAAIVLDPYYASLPPDDIEVEDFIKTCSYAAHRYQQTVTNLLKRAPSQLSKTEKRKWARGKARQLLPHALETRMVVTGNLRSWREFLVKRSSRHAEAEIRRLTHRIWWDVLVHICPNVWTGLTTTVVDDYIEFTE